MSFKGAGFLVLIAASVLLLRRASAAARHLLWLLGIAGVAALPLCSVGLPEWRILPAWADLQISSSPVESEISQARPTSAQEEELPPASSVLASAETDSEGNFAFDNVPVGFEWQFQTERPTQTSHRLLHVPEPKSPTFSLERAGEVNLELELVKEQNELRILRDSDVRGASRDTPPRKGAGDGTATSEIVTGEKELASMQNDFANTAQTRRQSGFKVMEIPDQSEAADENLGRQTSDISERLIRLHNEEIKLVEDKLALLKENLADQEILCELDRP